MSDVSIVKCDNYTIDEAKAALSEAIGAINGFDFIKPDMCIVIKTNLITMLKPETAATTHPTLLSALVDLLIERGCRVIVGDSPGGLYNAAYLERVYSVTGVRETVEHGASLNDDFSQATASFPEAVTIKQFEYTAYLDKADAIINFCKLKTHGMMGMSAAVKNMFGTVPGIFKPEYHFKYPKYEDFGNMLIDLNEYFKPSLCIVDAVMGMEGNGPTMGTPRKIGAIAASKSPYALDLVCTQIIGVTPSDVPTVSLAIKRGLSPERIEDIDIYGDLDSFKISDYKTVPVLESLEFDHGSSKFLSLVAPIAAKCLRSRPKLTKAECIGCAKCSKVCPANAIVMKNKRPVIDRSRCIRCFCCQELCPVGALKIHRPLVARIINKSKEKKKSKK